MALQAYRMIDVRTGEIVVGEYEDGINPTPEEALQAARAAMACTPEQMRIALHRMGKLAQVQAIAESDPEAAILWDFASVIKRTSPLIDAMEGDFTPEEVDDIFRAAMALEV